MILIIDNYDSFSYNLFQYIGELDPNVEVVRNDRISLEDVIKMHPDKIIISPGPGRPEDAGICLELIKKLGNRIPIFGVCLGHQCIGEAFGGKVVQAESLLHGKTSMIYHSGDGIFKGLESPFEGARYHSLIVERESLPKDLVITAETKTGEVMGIKHKNYPVFGVQFHPESIMTFRGKTIISNFLNM